MSITQDNRLIAIETPLGKDELLLLGFKGREAISELFSFKLGMISENHSIIFKEIIGKIVTLNIQLPDGKIRLISGIINRFSQGRGGEEKGSDPRFTYYSATMVPWVWLLTQTKDSRIFQELSVPEIVEKILTEKDLLDYKILLRNQYEKRNYCVQYRETDYNFISRLFAEEGIFFYFEHETGKHTLIIADNADDHPLCPDQENARYQISGEGFLEENTISALEFFQEIRTNKYTLNDFNFEMPNTDLKTEAPGKELLTSGVLETYDQPGRYDMRDRGEKLSSIRMQAEEVGVTRIKGQSNCMGFISGYRFVLQEYYREDINEKPYVLTFIELEASQRYSLGDAETPLTYNNTFAAIPLSVSFRPPMTAQKPVVQGTQTAIVVGPSGEEIYTDEYGRVKVQFHWDREGQRDDKSSCWIRVSQTWAGPMWGGMFIPRIGQEVIVDFLEGDPDRPIIIGRVYNGVNMPPYKLPDEKTKSTIKSDSSPGGDGFNEIRYEDKKGEEQIFIHAEMNQDNRVKNDSYEWIGNDRHLIIKNDQFELIERDKHLTIKGDHNEKVNGTISVETPMDLQEKVGMKHALDAGMEIHLKAGMNVVIEAGMSITLKAGGGFIVVGPTGVTISGTPVLINSGGSAGSGSGSSPEAPKEPKEAASAKPGKKTDLKSAQKAEEPDEIDLISHGAQFQVFKDAAKSGKPFCEKCAQAALQLSQ